jgi:hypothetical protein
LKTINALNHATFPLQIRNLMLRPANMTTLQKKS